MYLDKFLDKLEHLIHESNVELDLIDNQEDDDFEIKISKKICFILLV